MVVFQMKLQKLNMTKSIVGRPIVPCGASWEIDNGKLYLCSYQNPFKIESQWAVTTDLVTASRVSSSL